MKMSALNLMLIRDLWRLRGQVVAMALVVASGIATYVTMRGSYDSLLISQAEYYESCRFADVFVHLKRAPESVAGAVAAIPGVGSVQSRIVVEVTLDVPGLDEPATGRLLSIPEKHSPMLNDVFIRSGRYVEPERRDEVLVSEAFAQANRLRPGSELGAVINGRWDKLRIVGVALSPEYVYEIRGADVFPDNKRFGVLWMSREALGPSFNMEGAFNDLSVSLSPGASEPAVIEQIDLLLDMYGGLGAFGRQDQVSHRFVSDEIAQDKITGIFIPSIFLGIAAFLINLVLSRLVSTQRSQIAVLKAFGYDNLRIARHYLEVAMVAVLLGTLVGIGTGIWLGSGLSRVYSGFFRFPALHFEVGITVVALAVMISLASASAGALLAVRRAVSLPPAEAMQPEPPPRFGPGLVEAAHLSKLLPASVRIIVRNIERRSWRTFLSITAIALGVAILFVGRNLLDSVTYIIDVQLQAAQREDVTVVFNEPRGDRAKHDVQHLPGVLTSEPFRIVPARLRFEHRWRRIGITGLDPDGQLRPLVDGRLRPIDLPPDGLLLTDRLAQDLGVSPGNSVRVEVLEGKRPSRQVAVAGLIDEPIGLSAYMDITALNRLMREGETTSGSFLAVDSLLTDQLYSFLKRTPAVAGVSVRETMLASFRDTIQQSISISTGALIIFACVIAFAVVYNSARISLSERGHELASLRVLGFTRQEISVILLGEQAILTMLAIPLGFALGFGISVLMTQLMTSDLYRMPIVVSRASFAFAFAIVATAALLSGLLILVRLYRLDLIAVLKARE
jgi:putative ABC transport system permease protein